MLDEPSPGTAQADGGRSNGGRGPDPQALEQKTLTVSICHSAKRLACTVVVEGASPARYGTKSAGLSPVCTQNRRTRWQAPDVPPFAWVLGPGGAAFNTGFRAGSGSSVANGSREHGA